ncbi:hypothetical protein [Sorangium sp. So ce176]
MEVKACPRWKRSQGGEGQSLLLPATTHPGEVGLPLQRHIESAI